MFLQIKDNLKIVSYNINGINHAIQREKILTQLKKLNCTIGLVQETNLNETEHAKLKGSGQDRYLVHPVKTIKKGVAILRKKSLCCVVENVLKDEQGHWITVTASIGGITNNHECLCYK